MSEPAHNLKALLVGTVEFRFSENATSEADAEVRGWLDMGNIEEMTPTIENEQLKHEGSYRGKKRADRTISTKNELSYTLKADEWNLGNVTTLFGGSTGVAHVQSAFAAADADDMVFTAGAPSNPRVWYNLLDSGARVTTVTAVTFTSLVLGTDYVIDPLLGAVQFITEQTSTVTPVVTAPVITASDVDYMTGILPLEVPTRSGYGDLIIYDQDVDNKVVARHHGFSCDLSAESAGAVNGTAFSEINLLVAVTDSVGNILLRNVNQAIGGVI